MTVRDLIEILNRVPNEAGVRYQDPNFGGEYWIKPNKTDFSYDEDGSFLISFPFEEPVD